MSGRSSRVSSVFLLSHPTMQDLAAKVSEECNRVVRGNTLSPDSRNNRRAVVLNDYLKWGHFSDSFPNIFIENVEELAGKDVIFFASFHIPGVIFEQLSAIYCLPGYLVRSFKLVLPYFPTGTMERVDIEGQIVTAKVLARLLSAIPLCSHGPAQILIYDIHALQERFYFGDNVIIRLESAIPVLIRRINELEDGSNVAIAFPDEGAFKRFHLAFESDDVCATAGLDNQKTGRNYAFPLIVCTKVRGKDDKRTVTIKEGSPAGKHVIIVDDLVKTGGTLLECAKALVAHGAKEVSIYVTHAVFPQESWKRFIPENLEPGHAIKHFWMTDSHPLSKEMLAYSPPFEVLSLAEQISSVLGMYDLRSASISH
eukprot:Nk52_evm36s1569 gene=Nk52_evmTU36s1569